MTTDEGAYRAEELSVAPAEITDSDLTSGWLTRVGNALESACAVIDNRSPQWAPLAGWLRCPNGWLARAAFWCYARADRDWLEEATFDHAADHIEHIGEPVNVTGPNEWACCGTRIQSNHLVRRPVCWRCQQPMQPCWPNS